MEQGTITNKLAEKVAKWLMKDIKLNAEAASSGHVYEPEMPSMMKDFKQDA